MTQQGHSDRAHALLSASSAHRWMKCPPSVRHSERVKKEGSDSQVFTAAEEGTVAHELSELHFAYIFQGMEKDVYLEELSRIKRNVHYNDEMEQHISRYVDHVKERILNAHLRGAVITLFEEKVDLSRYIPNGFGTADVVIYAEGVLEIIDLKYGRRRVEVKGNEQLKLYGLGAAGHIGEHRGIEKVIMTIYQPRVGNIASTEMDWADLKEWGLKTVKPRALEAYQGKGSYNAGDHCKFCPLKDVCSERKRLLGTTTPKATGVRGLTDSQLAEELDKKDAVLQYYKDIEEEAYRRAEGTGLEGYKLVAGKGQRKYTDEVEVERLLKENYADHIVMEPPKIKSPAKLEKVINKRELGALISHLVVKSPGKPKLVKDTDSRPALSEVHMEFTEIAE